MRGIDSAVNSVTSAKYYPKENLRRVPLRKKMSVEEYVEGVKRGPYDSGQGHYPH